MNKSKLVLNHYLIIIVKLTHALIHVSKITIIKNIQNIFVDIMDKIKFLYILF